MQLPGMSRVARGMPRASSLAPPVEELLEVDRSVAVHIDLAEPRTQLLGLQVDAEVVQELRELRELQPLIAVLVDLVEQLLQVRELIRAQRTPGRSVGIVS